MKKYFFKKYLIIHLINDIRDAMKIRYKFVTDRSGSTSLRIWITIFDKSIKKNVKIDEMTIHNYFLNQSKKNE